MAESFFKYRKPFCGSITLMNYISTHVPVFSDEPGWFLSRDRRGGGLTWAASFLFFFSFTLFPCLSLQPRRYNWLTRGGLVHGAALSN